MGKLNNRIILIVHNIRQQYATVLLSFPQFKFNNNTVSKACITISQALCISHSLARRPSGYRSTQLQNTLLSVHRQMKQEKKCFFLL